MQTTHEDFSLDQDESIKSGVDSFGRKWSMRVVPRTHFFTANPEPAREDFEFPKSLQGIWTNKAQLERAIKTYIEKTWKMANKLSEKNFKKSA